MIKLISFYCFLDTLLLVTINAESKFYGFCSICNVLAYDTFSDFWAFTTFFFQFSDIPPKIVTWATAKELFVPPKAANFTCEASGTGKLE